MGRDRDDDRGRDRDRDRDRDDRGSRRRDDDDRGGRSFKYQRRSADEARKRAKDSGSKYHGLFKVGVKVFQVKSEDYCVRIMPPTWEDAKHYGFDVYVHRDIGPDGGTYLCPKGTYDKPCPICEEHERAKRKREDEDYIKQMKPGRVVVVYVIDRDKEKEGPQLWAMPWWTIDRELTAQSEDKRTREVLPIDDPDDGYDVNFSRAGSKRNVKYSGLTIQRKKSPLCDDPDVQRKWLKFAVNNPVPDQLLEEDYDTLKEVLEGTGDPTSDDDDKDKDKDRVRDRDRDEKPRTRDRYVEEDDDKDDDRSSRRASRDDDDRGSRRGDDDDDDLDKPRGRVRVRE